MQLEVPLIVQDVADAVQAARQEDPEGFGTMSRAWVRQGR